ncbi:MAG: DNRLRE domain-containing protein [Planctomycetota bacterium]
MRICSCQRVITLSLFSVLCSGALTSGTYAATVMLGASKDNTLFSNESTGNVFSNALGSLFAGRTGPQGPGAQRALLAFDVASAIPAGATITDAQLTLDIARSGGGSGNDVYTLHRVEKDWGEGTSDTTRGEGVAATPGDATWIHTIFDSETWDNPGGDFRERGTASATLSNFGPATWESTTQMVLDVQAWLDDPSSNFGWILIGDESVSSSSRQFGSRESSFGAPVLQIGYVIPEPTSAMLLLFGVAGAATARRR